MTDQEITGAIEELFQVCTRLNRKALWNAVVPTDSDIGYELPPGQRSVTFMPSFEFFELEGFIDLVDSVIGNPSLPEKDKIRLMLTGYCRIMESDLPLAIVWNLLRAASGQPESWRFTRITKSGGMCACEYPREKIEEIRRLAKDLSMKIGNVLNALWDPGLRNSVSHSQYFLTDKTYVPSRGLSPISRKVGEGIAAKGCSMTFDEVKSRYRLARTFATTVASNWRQACSSLD